MLSGNAALSCQNIVEHGSFRLAQLRDHQVMSSVQILSEEFAHAALAAGLRARRNALASGHPVVFVDDCGRFVEELPDATVHEVRFRSGTPRESHLEIVKEIFLPVK